MDNVLIRMEVLTYIEIDNERIDEGVEKAIAYTNMPSAPLNIVRQITLEDR